MVFRFKKALRQGTIKIKGTGRFVKGVFVKCPGEFINCLFQFINGIYRKDFQAQLNNSNVFYQQ